MTGHVFVIQGDTRRFACDAYLHATDRELGPRGKWTSSAPDAPNRLDPEFEQDFRDERRFTLPLTHRPGRENEPTTILTAVPYDGVTKAADIAPRLDEFFRVAADIAQRRHVTMTLAQRSRPLLAVPLFGAGGGGGGAFRGELFRVIQEHSRAAARTYDVDVAIVLRDPRDYALAQVIRRDDAQSWRALDSRLQNSAKALGTLARSARLVPFMGAGVSMSAGAPSWSTLIETLAEATGLRADLVAKLIDKHDVLDQAAYVRDAFERRFPERREEFTDAIIAAVNKRRYGLAAPLLAALEAEEAITLNYDKLFEWAAIDGQRPRRVIPGETNENDRWLLKLHGSVDDPSSIVLTRDDYLGFNSDRAALSSLVKATLMTRHLLFVGFGMTDSHFHEIIHDVRRALPKKTHKFGTVLTLTDDEITSELWKNDLDFIKLDDGRHLEIFLDAVLAHSATSSSYLLADGYGSALNEKDAAVRTALKGMIDSIPGAATDGSAWRAVERALTELGHGSASAGRAWGGLPEGLE